MKAKVEHQGVGLLTVRVSHTVVTMAEVVAVVKTWVEQQQNSRTSAQIWLSGEWYVVQIRYNFARGGTKFPPELRSNFVYWLKNHYGPHLQVDYPSFGLWEITAP